jgi:hypothetical protein
MDNQEIADIARHLAGLLPKEFVILGIERFTCSQGKTYRIGLELLKRNVQEK